MDACHIEPISYDHLSPKNAFISSAFAKLFQAAVLIASLKAGEMIRSLSPTYVGKKDSTHYFRNST